MWRLKNGERVAAEAGVGREEVGIMEERESLDGGFSSPGRARWLHLLMCLLLRALHVCAQ